MSVDAAQFCLCKNQINCLLSMKRAPADACFVQSLKYDKLDLASPLSCENVHRTHIISLVFKYL